MTASEPSRRETKNVFGSTPPDSEAKLNILLVLKQKKNTYKYRTVLIKGLSF